MRRPYQCMKRAGYTQPRYSLPDRDAAKHEVPILAASGCQSPKGLEQDDLRGGILADEIRIGKPWEVIDLEQFVSLVSAAMCKMLVSDISSLGVGMIGRRMVRRSQQQD